MDSNQNNAVIENNNSWPQIIKEYSLYFINVVLHTGAEIYSEILQLIKTPIINEIQQNNYEIELLELHSENFALAGAGGGLDYPNDHSSYRGL